LAISDAETVIEEPFCPYDENLLERARTQWQFGDWESLVQLDRDSLQHHPDRAKLALLAAAGNLQVGATTEARKYVRLAQDWGCSKQLISRFLIAGVHNSLGRASTVSGHQNHALPHFEKAVAIGTPDNDVRLLTQARVKKQLDQLWVPMGNVALQHPNTATSTVATTAQQALAFQSTIRDGIQKLKAEIKEDLNADLKANYPNPYVHNRTLTPALNKALRQFGTSNLQMKELKANYIDYLAAKAIQIERNCVGRLATTVQDAVARQLIAECIQGERLCVLEIGALYGISLAILYNHGVVRFKQVQVVCLDPFDGYYGKAVDAVLNSPVNDLTFFRNMRLSNVPPEDYRMLKHYSTAPEALAGAEALLFNLLIIDGDHSYEGVKFDFDNYFPLLKPGGFVIFDDYNAKEWPGVQKFIDEDLGETPDLEFLGAVSRTAVARKKQVPAK
jgi:hypothetical protein